VIAVPFRRVLSSSCAPRSTYAGPTVGRLFVLIPRFPDLAQQSCPPIPVTPPDPSALLFSPQQKDYLGEIISEHMHSTFLVIDEDDINDYLRKVADRVVRQLPECYGSTLDQEVSMTEADLYVFMARHRFGILATICPNATPQSALMGIAITPQLEIVFDTVKSSRKYPNLIARPACSFVIGGWGAGEQTVQYEGEAQELESPDLERYQTIYFQVWPDGPARMRWPGIVYFIVRPTWIRYSDFDQNPPLIREFTFRSGRAGQA